MPQCKNCNWQVPDGAKFCDGCGQTMASMASPPISVQMQSPAPQAATADVGGIFTTAQILDQLTKTAPAPQAQNTPQAPAPVVQQVAPPANNNVFTASILNLRCPECGANDLIIAGIKGSGMAALGSGLAFGAIGNIVAGIEAAANIKTEPLEYKCAHCKNKFESMPLQAMAEELLAAPCTINFQRMSSFVGSVIPQIVYLNGTKIGPVRNGKSIQFITTIKYNTVFVADQHGQAFPDASRFEATAGGTVQLNFNRKFK